MNKQQFFSLSDKFKDWVNYMEESGIDIDLTEVEKVLLKNIQSFSQKFSVIENEPDDYEKILEQCPTIPKVDEYPQDYESKIRGAVIGRFAGCTLGAPVEGWQIDAMVNYAQLLNMEFPPKNYWKDVINRENIQYEASKRYEFTESEMDGVPADDDVMYPLLNMMLVEKYGKDFTIDDMGKHWLDNMTVCCTAEYEALENLKKGVPAEKCAEGNPYVEWIGAAIRADLYGYICPGDPLKAAKMAYNDAYLSHRRTGIYGEMYFAAVIASAFTAKSIKDALLEGLKVIPENCRLAQDIKWAIEYAPNVKDYKQAREAVDKRFPGMFWVHTRNNTCLVIFALLLAEDNYTKLISECVAMGHDNDCTTATAGSIFGAFYGIEKIDKKWYEKFNNKIKCFLQHDKFFQIEDVINRITELSKI